MTMTWTKERIAAVLWIIATIPWWAHAEHWALAIGGFVLGWLVHDLSDTHVGRGTR
jgi:hypothetical protein